MLRKLGVGVVLLVVGCGSSLATYSQPVTAGDQATTAGRICRKVNNVWVCWPTTDPPR